MEEWKQVEAKGVPLLVSRSGQVRTMDRDTPYTRIKDGKPQDFVMKFKGRILSPCKNNMGYLEVATRHMNRRVYKFLVHRLVAMAFVPGYAEGLTVNHKNGDKTDNRIDNLEWVSLGRNTQHAWETGLVDLRGENQPGAKLTYKQVSYIKKLLKLGVPISAIAGATGTSVRLMALIRDGQRWADIHAAK